MVDVSREKYKFLSCSTWFWIVVTELKGLNLRTCFMLQSVTTRTSLFVFCPSPGKKKMLEVFFFPSTSFLKKTFQSWKVHRVKGHRDRFRATPAKSFTWSRKQKKLTQNKNTFQENWKTLWHMTYGPLYQNIDTLRGMTSLASAPSFMSDQHSSPRPRLRGGRWGIPNKPEWVTWEC